MDGYTRVRLDVAYDGTDFSGWAAQPGRRTVAGVLAEVLSKVLGAGTATGLTVAGRTDAGVHATGQVCHVDLPDAAWAALAPTRCCAGSPGCCRGDVRVRAVTEVPDEFDARFSATFRRYEYRVTDAPHGAEPLRRHDTLGLAAAAGPGPRWTPRRPGWSASTTSRRTAGARSTRPRVREVTRLDWRRDPDGILVATVQADAFCQSMVRSLVGAMLVGRRRAAAGRVAGGPAHAGGSGPAR